MDLANALVYVIPGTIIALALIVWLILATTSGLRGQEPFESHPGTLLRRIRELEERVERLERGDSGH